MSRAAAGVLAAALLSLGCPGGAPLDCPQDLPSACPTPAPSYATTVSGIFQARCAPCHAEGGLEGSLPLTTYQEIQLNRRVVLSQVYGCLMPLDGPSDSYGGLTPDERQALLQWLVCGAPDN